MNKYLLFSLFIASFSIIACKQDAAVTETKSKKSSIHSIAKATSGITLDGHGADLAWSATEWHTLDHTWVGEEPTPEDFSGRYKLLWDVDFLYILAETIDDKLVDTHEDGLDRYWDDDCLELFIDENNSDGDHQYNNSAYAYHVATNLRVADIGQDKKPVYLDHHLQSSRVTDTNNTTIWEIKMRVYPEHYGFATPPRKLKAGETIGFMVAYCDNDNSEEREHFVGSIAIEGKDKNRGWIDAGVFNDWVLAE